MARQEIRLFYGPFSLTTPMAINKQRRQLHTCLLLKSWSQRSQGKPALLCDQFSFLQVRYDATPNPLTDSTGRDIKQLSGKFGASQVVNRFFYCLVSCHLLRPFLGKF